MQDKNEMIEKQKAEITNLRKKNYEFRSKITDLEDKLKENQSRASSQNNAEEEIAR